MKRGFRNDLIQKSELQEKCMYRNCSFILGCLLFISGCDSQKSSQPDNSNIQTSFRFTRSNISLKEITSITNYGGAGSCLSPNNDYLLVDSGSELFDLVEIFTWKKIKTMSGKVVPCNYSPDKKYLTLRRSKNGKERLVILDTTSWTEAKDLQEYIRNGLFSPDGKYLATWNRTGPVIYDVATWSLVQNFTASLWTDKIVAFTMDSQSILIQQQYEIDNARVYGVKFYDIQSGKVTKVIETPQSTAFENLQMSPDGKYLATVSSDHLVEIRDLTSGEIIKELGRNADSYIVRFSPNGKLLFVSGQWIKKSNKVYSVEDGKEVFGFDNLGGAINEAVFSPDNRTLAVAGYEHSDEFNSFLRVFDTTTWKEGQVSFSEGYVFLDKESFTRDSRYLTITHGFWKNGSPDGDGAHKFFEIGK